MRSPIGSGIRDGRGYGPYGMGYWRCGPGNRPSDWCPYGPSGEKLGAAYDYTTGPSGDYLPHGPPQMNLKESTMGCSSCVRGFGPIQVAQLGMTPVQKTGLVVGGLLLAAGGLAYAFRPKRRRFRRGLGGARRRR